MSRYVISESTKNILKNFASISESIVLKDGAVQRTVNPGKSILAIATFDTPWPMDTPIFKLPEFLSNVNSYDKPMLDFEQKQFVIRGANSPSHVEYPYSDPSVVLAAPDKTFPTDNPLAVFVLSDASVREIKKFSAINDLPTVLIDVNGEAQTVVIKPFDDKNPASRTYSYPVHSDPNNISQLDSSAALQFRFKREHFDLLMDGAYTVYVGDWSYVYFEHRTEKISYYVVKKS